MLKEQPSHEEYIRFVETWLDTIYPQGPPPVHAHVATMLMLVNLTPMRKIIQHLYSGRCTLDLRKNKMTLFICA